MPVIGGFLSLNLKIRGVPTVGFIDRVTLSEGVSETENQINKRNVSRCVTYYSK